MKQMRTLMAVLTLALITGCAAAATQSGSPESADLTGRWTGTLWVASSRQPTRVAMYLTRTGEEGTLTGWMEIPEGAFERSTIEDGTVADGRLEAILDYDTGTGSTLPIQLDLEFVQGSLRGSFRGNILRGDLSLTR